MYLNKRDTILNISIPPKIENAMIRYYHNHRAKGIISREVFQSQ